MFEIIIVSRSANPAQYLGFSFCTYASLYFYRLGFSRFIKGKILSFTHFRTIASDGTAKGIMDFILLSEYPHSVRHYITVGIGVEGTQCQCMGVLIHSRLACVHFGMERFKLTLKSEVYSCTDFYVIGITFGNGKFYFQRRYFCKFGNDGSGEA